MLDNIDRRQADKLKDFFRQIPFLRNLPRKELNMLHLSLIKKSYDRGQVVCREGHDSTDIYIVLKGEFEVSKVIDVTE